MIPEKLTKEPCSCGCKKFFVEPLISCQCGTLDKEEADELIKRWNNYNPELQSKNAEKLRKIRSIITRYGFIDGAHHKQWVLAEVIKIATGDKYEKWVEAFQKGEDGDFTYEFDEGIAP